MIKKVGDWTERRMKDIEIIRKERLWEGMRLNWNFNIVHA